MPPSTKRRKTAPEAIEEISFDPAARHEYLTGFHKRKLQRTKQAQEAAERKARAERIADRRKLREERKADLARHLDETDSLMRSQPDVNGMKSLDRDVSEEDSSTEWAGLSDASSEEPSTGTHYEAEYVDEDKNTTVTVEAMDVSRNGLYLAEQARSLEREDVQSDEEDGPRGTDAGRKEAEQRNPPPETKRPKKRRKAFHYENKSERKATRLKERMKNGKQARARRAR